MAFCRRLSTRSAGREGGGVTLLMRLLVQSSSWRGRGHPYMRKRRARHGNA